MQSRRMVYETVTVQVQQVKKDKIYCLIYTPDFVNEDETIKNKPSVNIEEGNIIQFNWTDVENRPYRHTSKRIPFKFELSDRVVNGQTYQVTYKGKNPQEYISS